MSLQENKNIINIKSNESKQQAQLTGKKQQNIIVSIIYLVAMLITMLTTFTLAASSVDVTPPRGKIEIQEAKQVNNVNYVGTTEIDVLISAKDDICEDSEIKYVLRTTEISNTTEIAEDDWKIFESGKTEKLTLSNANVDNTIYLVLKDKTGNTSLIYEGNNVEYTIEYNVNGGIDFTSTVATKAYYGMPFKVTSLMPTRENYYFAGWSTDANATDPSYKRGDIIPANVFVGGGKTITLYAVWSQNENGSALLSDVVMPGDYVSFPVSYDNVNGSDYSGWRVISKDVDLDGNVSIGTVNIVSAGTPLTYYHADSSANSETALTDNFLLTPISNTENYTYRKSGFSSSETLTETFTNKYVATKADGTTPQVRALNADDIYKATKLASMSDGYTMGLNDSKYENLFANEAIYWLASQKDATNLWSVAGDGYVEGKNNSEYGVRPVVSLKAGTTVTGQGSQGEWKMHIRATVEKPIANGTYTYNGNEQTLVLDNFDSNYMTITGNKETEVGSYTAVVTLKDTRSYEWSDGTIGPLNIGWTINAKDVSTLTIDSVAEQMYIGSPLTPTPSVKDGNATLASGSDFTYSYSNNDAPGIGSVIVNGIGNYTGSKTITFTIIPSDFSVTLDQQSGSGGSTSITATYLRAMPSATMPKRTGYTFGGYFTGTNGSGTKYYNADGTSAKNWDKLEGITLYAKWTINTYTITYNANGGSLGEVPSSATVTYGTNYTITNKEPQITSPRDKIFLGWSTSEQNANQMKTEYKAGETFTATGNVTLYASYGLRPSIANSPVLGTGMQAVYWSDENASKESTATSYTSAMYNYTIGDGVTDSKLNKWANAKTTEDGSYWVWIPRYAYNIIYYTNSSKTTESTSKTKYGDIDILFMYGTSDTHYRDKNGEAKVLPDGYIVHPAFQAMKTTVDKTTNPLGKWDRELEGIWVAKYEASMEISEDGSIWETTSVSSSDIGNVLTTKAGNRDSNIRIVSKPSVNSWRSIDQTNIYINCEKMYEKLGSHEMKNSEWGAVAYLTHSAYGRNGNELADNQCSSFYTGGGPGEGDSTVKNSVYSYSEDTFANTYAWNTTQGKLASTTGNIYGVYDISGRGWSFVAAYVNNGKSYLTEYGANMVSSDNLKNKQIYPEETYNSEIYGDAVYETSISGNSYSDSWYDEWSTIPSRNPFFGRGGGGAFDFNGAIGKNDSVGTFRPVLCVSSGT